MIAALAFLPLEDVWQGFDELSEILPEECDPIYIYFKNTYIGDPNPGRRLGTIKADFSPIQWNLNKRVLEDLPKTNNQ